MARFVSVVAECLSIYLVYRISQILFKENKRIAFFTANGLIFVQLSHFGRI